MYASINMIIIGSDNYLNNQLLLITQILRNFSDIKSKYIFFIHEIFLLKSAANWQPYCSGVDELTNTAHVNVT